MNYLVSILQVAVALGLLNVWLLRFNKITPYRGGSAKNLKEEFIIYGLPKWFVYLIGALKIGSAVALLVGFWVPSLVIPSASLIVVLMIGALLMHVKVKDPIVKSLPAAIMLTMGITINLVNLK